MPRDGRAYPAGMLPDGFYWAKRWEHDSGANAIYLDGQQVAWVDIKAGVAGWLARLEVQKPFEHPLVLRDCSSYEAGRRGCELWVCRHEERLRREVAEAAARRKGRS